MTMPKILVTGASGKTGAALVHELLARDVPVRALVHRRDARSEALERRGAEIAVADLFDAEQVAGALRGTQRAYFVPFFHPEVSRSATIFAAAARREGIEQIVHLGQWLSHAGHPAVLTREIARIDRIFAEIPGMAHTTINPGMFADNFLRVIDFATLLGILPILTGEGLSAPVSNEDIARTAAAVLLEPARFDRASLRPTGPALLSGRDIGRIVAKVVGHAVRPVELPWFLFLKVARQQGVNPFEIASLRHYREEMRRGSFALDGGVTRVVEAVTGRPAESFETTARRYAAMPFARVTMARRLKALAAFLIVPLLPSYDLRRWEKEAGIAPVADATLSIDDAEWMQTHRAIMARSGFGGAAPRLLTEAA